MLVDWKPMIALEIGQWPATSRWSSLVCIEKLVVTGANQQKRRVEDEWNPLQAKASMKKAHRWWLDQNCYGFQSRQLRITPRWSPHIHIAATESKLKRNKICRVVLCFNQATFVSIMMCIIERKVVAYWKQTKWKQSMAMNRRQAFDYADFG